MQLEDKTSILSGAAKYDVSCASSGSRRRNKGKGMGSASCAGICHSWSDDGRCISLLKILLTNRCMYDCAYCANRCSNPVPRAAFTPEEVVDLTVNFYKRNYIEGLFLSSGVERSPDYTMEQLVRVVRALRMQHEFHGYIHVKAIPGASETLIEQAGRYADRVSVNIELPSERSLNLLAPQKKRDDILMPMDFLGRHILANRDERTRSRRAPLFAPAGQSTQMVVSASPEPDCQILHLAESLYRRYRLKRVYYSAYVPVNEDARLPCVRQPELLREHRLYQADWLVRFYNFTAGELVDEAHPQLDRDVDPKSAWALNHFERFPIEVTTADYETLLRVPGLGVRSARRIIGTRRHAPLRFEDLPKIGVVMKRARYFLTCHGRFAEQTLQSPEMIRALLAPPKAPPDTGVQLSLFGEM